MIRRCGSHNRELKMAERSDKKDYSVSCARFVAMCFIVICHMMQKDGFASDISGAHIEWAYWFNTGVQMFLFISGFLYGAKDTIKPWGFCRKNLPKLLVDYVIFVGAMILIMFLAPSTSISTEEIKSLLSPSVTIPGLEHLWFMPLILFCYLLVPLFSWLINAIDKKGDLLFASVSALVIIILHFILKHFVTWLSAAWVNCFVIGMIYSRLRARKKLRVAFDILAAVLCLVLIPFQFYFDYWSSPENLPGIISSHYIYLVQYGRVFLGIVLVLLIRTAYIKLGKSQKRFLLLNWSDRYSYDVYLVHPVFVYSAFACVEYIPNRWIALPLAVVFTVAAAMLLGLVSDAIRKGIGALFAKKS